MVKGRSTVVRLAALLALGAMVAAGGCSKLQSSLDKRETVTLGDMATRVATLEQQVTDLQAAATQQVGAEPMDPAAGMGPREASQRIAKGARATVRASFLNVREAPRTDAVKVGTLQQGAMVQVTDVEGDWVKIRVKHKDQTVSGWVAQEFLQREDE